MDQKDEKIRQFTSQAYLDKTKLDQQDALIKKLSERVEALESSQSSGSKAVLEAANKIASIDHRLENLEKWRIDNDVTKQVRACARWYICMSVCVRDLCCGALVSD